jgi:organic radical activating enzyme
MKPSSIRYEKKKVIEIQNVSDSLFLTWIINNICTNKCSYCPSILHTGSNHHYEWHHAEKFIRECFKRHKKIHCSISGGEPTVSPFFKNLVNLVYDLGGTIHLTSNLVRQKEWWEDIADRFCGVSVSYHPEFMNEIQEEEFIEKIIYLSNHTYVTVRVMMHPKHWDKCINFYERLEKINYPFFMEMVRVLPNYGIGDTFCEINYTQEQDHILNTTKPVVRIRTNVANDFRHYDINSYMVFKNGKTHKLDFEKTSILENTKQNNFQGWECNIGLESLFVFFDGSVQRGNCAEGGIIGNITKNVDWPTSSIVCSKDTCHCIGDLLMSKKIL